MGTWEGTDFGRPVPSNSKRRRVVNPKTAGGGWPRCREKCAEPLKMGGPGASHLGTWVGTDPGRPVRSNSKRGAGGQPQNEPQMRGCPILRSAAADSGEGREIKNLAVPSPKVPGFGIPAARDR